MARKKPTRPVPQRTLELYERAKALFHQKKFPESLSQLNEFERRAPDYPPALILRIHLAQAADRPDDAVGPAGRLTELDPGNADCAYQYGWCLARAGHNALAARQFRQALRAWPGHPRAAGCRELVEAVEAQSQQSAESLGISGPDAAERLARHEQVALELATPGLGRAEEFLRKILARWPDDTSALVRLVGIVRAAGQWEKALALAEDFLRANPSSFTGRVSLAECLYLAGRPEEAREALAELKRIRPDRPLQYVQRMQAEALLGDDEGLEADFQVYAEAVGPEHHNVLALHLGAYAAARRGDVDRARSLWQRVTSLGPAREARANLEQLAAPEADREAPFALPAAFSLHARDLVPDAGGRPSARLLRLVPDLLERGEAVVREVLEPLARSTGSAELLDLLRAFAFGKAGAFAARQRVALSLRSLNALPEGPHQLWDGAGWVEFRTHEVEIHSEPDHPIAPHLAPLAEEAYDLLRRGLYAEAEPLLRRLVAGEPGVVGLRYNLYVALRGLGQLAEADALLGEITRDAPDYFFGHYERGALALVAGDLQEARRIIRDLSRRPRLHSSEASALYALQFQLAKAQNSLPGMRSAIGLLERLDPGNGSLAALRKVLAGVSDL